MVSPPYSFQRGARGHGEADPDGPVLSALADPRGLATSMGVHVLRVGAMVRGVQTEAGEKGSLPVEVRHLVADIRDVANMNHGRLSWRSRADASTLRIGTRTV